jgi:hypothetical protein
MASHKLGTYMVALHTNEKLRAHFLQLLIGKRIETISTNPIQRY